MKDLLAWFGLKGFPFDKNLKTQDVFETEPFKEAMARFDYIKRRGGILLLTGDPGVGKPSPSGATSIPLMRIFSNRTIHLSLP